MDALPIDEALPAVLAALRRDGAAVVEAPPGAGKTTRVPPAIHAAGLAGGGEVVVLEPRRLAARLAARRVAFELGEKPGETVGWQVRFEEVAGPRTRIRYVTEALLTRRLLAEPTLPGVGAVVLDEIHERHLAGDLALALLARLRLGARPDLKVVAMSATLDAGPVAALLGCQAVRSEGRRFEVAVEYLSPEEAARTDVRPEELVARAVRRVCREEATGDVLVFLPGAAEIRRAREALEPWAGEAGVDLVPLHGDLPPDEQDRAVTPGPRRKVILSTNVAETSVTIEGVTAVVDSGLARIASHSPWSGLPSLEVKKVSRASAAQRAGRAGRTGPGRALRLYTRHDHDARPAFDVPEILREDLAETALALASLGLLWPVRPVPPGGGTPGSVRPEPPGGGPSGTVRPEPPGGGTPGSVRPEPVEGRTEGSSLAWLDPPPAAALETARALLVRLGALETAGGITEAGRRMLRLPVHPRLARLALEAAARGAPARGALLAALLGERDLRERRSLEGTALPPTGPSDLLELAQTFDEAARARFDPGRLRRMGVVPAAAQAVDRARRQIERLLPPPSSPLAQQGPSRGGGPTNSAPRGVVSAAFPPLPPRERGERAGVRGAGVTGPVSDPDDSALLAATLAAYPDRVARRRSPGSDEVVLVGGGSARLDPASVVREAPLLVALDAEHPSTAAPRSGAYARDGRPRSREARVRLASAVTEELLLDLLPGALRYDEALSWNAEAERVEATERLLYEDLVLSEARAAKADPAAVAARLAEEALARGARSFAPEGELDRAVARLAFAAAQAPDAGIPAPDDSALAAALRALCEGKRSFAELREADLPGALVAGLEPRARAALEKVAPERLTLPGGRGVRVHYESGKPPWVESRLQDFFGLGQGPAVASGRVPLVLHLLAPNGRAVQVTTDLAGFWERHYPALRRELGRRYPRHSWPEDPLRASPPPPKPARR